MISKDSDTFYPSSKDEWRLWLKNNHSTQKSVWVIFYKKKSQIPSISWSDAVDEALCFGWIDSVKKTIDTEKYKQFFSQRKPNSTWSKINKDKVDYLIAKKLMRKAGLKAVEMAKQNGSWTIFDSAENLIIPSDLEEEFKTEPSSKEYFLSLSKSSRKSILQWIILAKRAETRKGRINEIVKLASQQLKPKQFR